MTVRKRCIEIATSTGKQCKRDVEIESEYCIYHNPESKKKKTPSKKQIALMEKENQAFMLRLASVGFRRIAEQLGYADASGAYRAYQRALDRLILEVPEEARKVELARLDQVAFRFFQMAMEGHTDETKIWLQISKARRELMGIDAPIELTTPTEKPLQVIIRAPNDD